MVYSDFTLQEVVQQFQLVIEEQHNLFAAIPEIEPGDFLCAILDENVLMSGSFCNSKGTHFLSICQSITSSVLAKSSGYCSRWWGITPERPLQGRQHDNAHAHAWRCQSVGET